jgi:hypothetical protein
MDTKTRRDSSERISCLGYAIEQHLESIPPKLKSTFQEILEDVKARKENLERS